MSPKTSPEKSDGTKGFQLGKDNKVGYICLELCLLWKQL
jgi:hypothetical protein